MHDFYGQFGYLETDVQLVRRPNITTGAIDIEFKITESERFIVESVEIEGNTKTKSVVVLREILLGARATSSIPCAWKPAACAWRTRGSSRTSTCAPSRRTSPIARS